MVYGDLTLYTAPGEGPDQLKLTGVSCFLDTIIDSTQGYKLFPQAHGAFVFEAAKAIFAATRRITLRMEPSLGKRLREINLRVSLNAGSS